MERYDIGTDENGPRVRVPYRGPQLLSHPMYNKSTAFTRDSRSLRFAIASIGDRAADSRRATATS